MPSRARQATAAVAMGPTVVPATATTSATAAYDRSVFLNCPFDEAYRPLLHAAIFTIHDCGFIARTALEDVGSGETRLDKIVRIIGESRFSIHDISRVESGGAEGEPALPRFNMPFECGLCFGAMVFAEPARARGRDLLILAGEPHQNQRTLSDLAGQDARYHRGQVEDLVKAVRAFLAAKARAVMPPETRIRGHGDIVLRLAQFRQALENRPPGSPISLDEINSFDYLPDWLSLATRWQAATP
jgi:hypothetical protein